MLLVLLALLVTVLAVADWWAVAREDRRAEALVKPATLLALTAAAVAGGATGDPAGRWLVAALLLGALGDWFLLADSDRRFLGGLGAFLLGHTAYVACFATLGLTLSAWTAAGGLALLGALVAGRRVLPAALADRGPSTALPVAAYMAVIGAMLVAAWATTDPLVALGATVFVASDTVLALDRFARPRRWTAPWPHLAVMVTYHLGQALVVVGVLRSLQA